MQIQYAIKWNELLNFLNMLTSNHGKYVVTLRNFKKRTFINHNSFYKRLSNNKNIFDDIFNKKFAKKLRDNI